MANSDPKGSDPKVIHRGLTPFRRYVADYVQVLGDARKKLPVVLLLSVAAVALDTVGVGLVAPLAGIIANRAPELAPDITRNFLLVSASLVAVFVAKGWLGYVLNRRIVRFSETHRAALVDRLMGAYQAMDWQTLVGRSSGELVNRTLWWTQSYASGTLSASIRLATDLLVFVCIGALLAWADALAVLLVLGVLGVLFLVIHAVVRPGQARAERNLLESYEQVSGGVTQALGALREVRVLGHEA